MKYKIATMSDGYAFYWLDIHGKTLSIYDKPYIFTLEDLLKILNDNLDFAYKVGGYDRGFQITQIDKKGKPLKDLNRSDFNIVASIKEV